MKSIPPSPFNPAKKFYVYTLSRPDGSVFYVGKGSGKRIHRHEAYARAGRDHHVCNIIRKVWRDGGVISKHKVFFTDDESEALREEARLIAFYGSDSLANKTSGGEHPTPYTRRSVSEETKQLLRKINLGQKRSAEARAAMSAAHKGKPLSEKQRAVVERLRAEGFYTKQGQHMARVMNSKPLSEKCLEARRKSIKKAGENLPTGDAHWTHKYPEKVEAARQKRMGRKKSHDYPGESS